MNKRRLLEQLSSNGLLVEEKNRGMKVPKLYRVKGNKETKFDVEWNGFVSSSLNMGGTYE